MLFPEAEAMPSSRLLTAEQFDDRLPDLEDGGRWAELEAGEIVTLDPPDEMHGNIVLNISKMFAAYLAARKDNPAGYACFELGLIVARNPDTVRRPPVSFFSDKNLFAETERMTTERVPAVVIETATTNRRRRSIGMRIEQYASFGVEQVWVVDSAKRAIHVSSREAGSWTFSEEESLSAPSLLPELSLPVGEVFAAPSWWGASR